MSSQRTPNFFVIGAAKAGTTSLYDGLGKHPEVFVSPVKEPQYLALEEGKFVAVDGYNNAARSIRSYPPVIQTQAQYEALFAEATDEKAVGEASTLYLYSKLAPQRIADRYPDAKIIVVLRNPVDRAFSQFLHHVRDGHETTNDFYRAFREEEERLDRGPFWHYRRMGFYYAQVKQYVDRFASDRIHVVYFEDIKKDMRGVLEATYRFLGVDEQFRPAAIPVRNKTGLPHNRGVNAFLFLARRYPVLRRVTHLIPEPVRAVIRRLRNRNLYKPRLSTAVRTELTQVYRDDIEQLETLLGCDLSSWKQIDGTTAI